MTGARPAPGAVVAPPVRRAPPARRPPTEENTTTVLTPPDTENTSSAVSTMLIVDSGVLAVALADDGKDGNQARRHLIGHRLLSVSSVMTEVLGIWRQALRLEALSPERVHAALRDLAELPLSLVDPGPLLNRCWELQAEVPIQDATVLALAESVAVPLITTNPRLADLTRTSARIVLLR
jgi:predicted nucleic acid-binding protein